MGKGRYLNSDGNTIIYASDLGSEIAGVDVEKKLFIQNPLSRESGQITGSIAQHGSSDLYSMVTWALCADTLSCPFNVSASLVTGGSLTTGVRKYYRITAYNENGETAGSLEVSALPSGSNLSIKLEWDELTGADGYIIYGTTDNSNYDSCRLMVIEDPETLEWTDTGSDYNPSGPYSFPGINTDYDLPDENTTAGESPDYGTIPATLTDEDLDFGILQSGEQKAFWIKIDSEVSTPETGNPRKLFLNFTENT
jgi:hypothetical protein